MIQSVLVQQAINAALNSQWQNAIELNEKILEQFPQDLDTLNRLARACLELGDVGRSQKIYKEVLGIDPYNVIASKNMRRFQLFKGTTEELSSSLVKSMKNGSSSKSVTNFIEEPGKTKVIQLVRLAEPHVLFTLHCGDPLIMSPKLRGVQVCTESNSYIGRLPDDIAFHLQYFMKNGNTYEAYVKQVQPNSVLVFVREMYRSPQFQSRPTFSYISESTPIPQEVAVETDADQSDDEESTEEQV